MSTTPPQLGEFDAAMTDFQRCLEPRSRFARREVAEKRLRELGGIKYSVSST